MTSEKGTISVHLLNEALLVFRQRGFDASALLEEAGIARDVLNKPYARVPSQLYGQLWLLIAWVLDDEFFGMNARRMKSGSYAYMTRAAIKEPTLGDALEVILGFLGLLFDDFTPRLKQHGGIAEIAVEEGPGQSSRAFSYFTLWLMIHGLMCWLVGRRIVILGVELRGPEPAYIEDYRVMFSSNLRFSRAQTRLLFNAECLQAPIRRSPQDLKRFLGGLPANILVRYRDPQSLAARVRSYLRSIRPGRWPTLEALASHFYMAPSTLRRKLSQEGHTYQGLKDTVRRDLAIACLDNGEGNFNELAFELGFADTSAFYKAFKKWTGSTPGQYRALMHPDSS